MTNHLSNPSDQDLLSLRSELEEARRRAEYEKLKSELYEVTYRASNTPNEFDGVMQMPDTHRALSTKRQKQHFFNLMLDRLQGMFSLRPIMGNIIALMMSGIALFYIFNKVEMAGFQDYENYFGLGIQITAALQIIKSATRGLLLPVLALLIGGSAAHTLGAHDTLLHFNKTFFQYLMLTGIVGLGVAVLTID